MSHIESIDSLPGYLPSLLISVSHGFLTSAVQSQERKLYMRCVSLSSPHGVMINWCDDKHGVMVFCWFF